MCASKLIVYTRHSYIFGLLPSSFSHNVTKENEMLLKGIIYEDVTSLKMLKVFLDTPEGDIHNEIENFIKDKEQRLFVLIANMQEITIKMVNFMRTVIEQKEISSAYDVVNHKVFVFLLHFPRIQFFNRCYPALFLSGWDHFYLDSLSTDISVDLTPMIHRSVVNIQQCLEIALDDCNSDLFLDLQPLLKVSIPIISSRVIVGSSGKEYNTTLSVSNRQEQLQKIFFKSENLDQDAFSCTSIGNAICSLFRWYWNKKMVNQFLENAANFAYCHQSTLSLASYIQTRIKALFNEFIIYVLWKINENCNMDTLFAHQMSEMVQNAFAGVIKMISNKLESLNILSCCSLPPPENKGFQFPFFAMTYHHLEELIDSCHKVVNEKAECNKARALVEKQIYEEMNKKLRKLIEVRFLISYYVIMSSK